MSNGPIETKLSEILRFIIEENVFEDNVCKMGAILFKAESNAIL